MERDGLKGAIYFLDLQQSLFKLIASCFQLTHAFFPFSSNTRLNMPHSPSLTRKRKFCRKRRPYNSHGKLEFSSILSSIGPVQDGLKSFRTVATEQNIRTTTLHRIHKKWVMLNKPSPHFITDLRGHKTILSAHDQQQLAQRIETQIDDERVIRYPHVKAAAVEAFVNADYYLRS